MSYPVTAAHLIAGSAGRPAPAFADGLGKAWPGQRFGRDDSKVRPERARQLLV